MQTRIPDAVRRTAMGPSAEDMSRFAELVGDARVVALGENNHHIAEFGELRARLVRFMVTELGFTVVAMESGATESRLVDDWIRGGAGALGDVLRDGFTFRFGDPQRTRELVEWLRGHVDGGGALRFAGLDVPGSGGTPRPALAAVRRYLAERSPGDVAFVDAADAATGAYRSANNGAAAQAYAGADAAARDAATAALTRLLLRVDALTGVHDDAAHAIARHDALGALRLDEHLRELDTITAPDPPPWSVSSRDVYQAETVRLLRRLHGPDARIVLLAHNGHLQRRPLQLLPTVAVPSAGTYLADALGDRYRAIGITAVAGTTTTAQPAADERHGIRIGSEPLAPPADDSLEAAVAGLTGTELLDLRPARRDGGGPTSIRHATTHAAVDVVDAFDGFICLPTMTPDALA